MALVGTHCCSGGAPYSACHVASLYSMKSPTEAPDSSNEHAADVGIHLRQSYLRLAIQADQGIIPRIE
jgi:hypothetical protein